MVLTCNIKIAYNLIVKVQVVENFSVGTRMDNVVSVFFSFLFFFFFFVCFLCLFLCCFAFKAVLFIVPLNLAWCRCGFPMTYTCKSNASCIHRSIQTPMTMSCWNFLYLTG